jgi:hypothetical protein
LPAQPDAVAQFDSTGLVDIQPQDSSSRFPLKLDVNQFDLFGVAKGLGQGSNLLRDFLFALGRHGLGRGRVLRFPGVFRAAFGPAGSRLRTFAGLGFFPVSFSHGPLQTKKTGFRPFPDNKDRPFAIIF